MGSVFGKETVAEPPFDVLLERVGQNVHTPYEVRQYGERFAAEVEYKSDDDKGTPFSTLASYIGVFGTPQNEGKESMAMTAPVVIKEEGTKIAMTAPVVTEESSSGDKIMKFMLPAEYDDMSKIPKPTNPRVKIEEIPPQAGAVHRFSGSINEDTTREKAIELAEQLMSDGLENMSVDYVLDNYEFFGYNPPFTLPMFRRNEVWVALSEADIQKLLDNDNAESIN